MAALYDVHGNLPALEAVIADLRQAHVDLLVIGGDVLPGPMPLETLDYLSGLDVPVRFLYGNGEVAVMEALAGREPSRVPRQYRDIIWWNAEQVAACRSALDTWPATVRVEVAAIGSVLFCHATPRNEDDIFTRVTPEHRLRAVFEDVAADVVVCGHTHMPFDRRVGSLRVVNAGSVGMPFGHQGADWLLLAEDIQLRHTTYDVSRAVDRITATACPHAREFFARQILNPPPEADMLAAYEAVALS